MRRFIMINGQHHASFGESTRLSRVCVIFDRASGCVHVTCDREGVASIHLLDLHRTIAISGDPSIVINHDHYNSLDGPLRLNEIGVFYDIATYPLSK